jgi:hypothetical protein
MKKIDTRHRPQPPKLELHRETMRRLDALALAHVRGAATQSWPLPTRDDEI